MTDENQRSGLEGDPPVSQPPPLGENWTPGVSTTTIMGCNLCTLQKREEHYKLLYEIAQVSGRAPPPSMVVVLYLSVLTAFCSRCLLFLPLASEPDECRCLNGRMRRRASRCLRNE